MPEKPLKIVAKKKLIGFSKEALDELKRKKNAAGAGATETGVIEDLILGRTKFNPFVEQAIALQQEEGQMSREQAIDLFLTKGVAALTTVEDQNILEVLKGAKIRKKIRKKKP